MISKEFAKKRLMFIQKEDYNYLTYNLIILLNELDCIAENKSFNDFKKISYLVDFIGSTRELKDFSQNELGSIYSKTHLKKKLISHLLIVLKNKNYIGISINKTHLTFNIWLKKDNIPESFFNRELFKTEIENIKKIKKEVRGLKRTTVKTMVDILYTSKNVLTWEI